MRYVVVTGPPCGGKSTFVAAERRQGDIVLDLDRMASALMGEDEITHDHPEHITRLAAAAHWRIRKLLPGMRDLDVTAFVIHANPSWADLHHYEARGWRVVTCDPGRKVVEERCARLRPSRAEAWVDEWYATHDEGGTDGA